MRSPSPVRPAGSALWAALAVCLAAAQAFSEEVSVPPAAFASLSRLAVQHNGRHKPLDSFARETLEQITGRPRLGDAPALQTALSIMAEPDSWQETPLVHVPFIPLRLALGMEEKQTHISYSELVGSRKLMRMLPAIVEKQGRGEKLSILENETMDVYNRFVVLTKLFQQELVLVPPAPDSGGSWVTIRDPQGYPPERQAALKASWAVLMQALSQREPQAILTAARRLDQLLRASNPSLYPADWKLHWEVLYNRIAPFRIARLFYLAAFLLLWASWSRFGRPAAVSGILSLWIGFLVHGAGILSRVVLGGRPPVSNFFETMLWLPFVAVGLGILFERIYRVRYFGLAAGLLGAVVLLLAEHLPLDSSISPVVAVLRSNLWLTIHVLTIVASYGALTLAVVLAHLYGIQYLAKKEAEAPSAQSLEGFLYRAIQVGVVLLTCGIMLGAVWANASWGRYWGWDPKETWALITLLWFLAMLHGRMAGWLKGVWVAWSTIVGFFLLLMTYYGVSFYLVGLHSYAGGHAKPLPPLLMAYLFGELAFLAAVGFKAITRGRQPV